MRLELIRPIFLRLWVQLRFFLRRRSCRPVVEIGTRCSIGKQCSINVRKRVFLQLGERAAIRAGCVVDLAKGANFVLGKRSEIRHYSIIECGTRVVVGNRSVIGAYNWLQGSGDIEIGNDVIIGPGVRIISTAHELSDPNLPFSRQPLRVGKVCIGNNVWLGANVIVLAGVSIGKNVVVGAGALVTRDLAAGGMYVGSPARRVKDVLSSL